MSKLLGVELEELNALDDAANYLYERGKDITLQVNSESSVTRDKLGSIKKRNSTEHSVHAYPVIFGPSSKELKKAGLKEKVDVIVTLATKHLTDLGISFEDINITRYEVTLEGNLYSIKDKVKKNHFSHSYLNIILGLYKK